MKYKLFRKKKMTTADKQIVFIYITLCIVVVIVIAIKLI